MVTCHANKQILYNTRCQFKYYNFFILFYIFIKDLYIYIYIEREIFSKCFILDYLLEEVIRRLKTFILSYNLKIFFHFINIFIQIII